jgi:predicted HAD superfamily hydrolase
MEMELQIEHEEVIPIWENLEKLQDGDLLVSDTYLNADTVRSLLQKAGLSRRVGLVVSNDGKYRGWIWPQLLKCLSIRSHLGDNEESDGKSPTVAGIPSTITRLSARTQVEQFLVERGWTPLANLIREVRLANSIRQDRPQLRHLWTMSCQLNFPLLYFASLELERYAISHGRTELFFVSRDCWMWQKLYREIFPHRLSTYLYGSRMCLFHPTSDYLDYFRATWHPKPDKVYFKRRPVSRDPRFET